MIRKLFRNETGVSLLEVMVSMLVLGIGVLGLAPMLVLSVETNVMSRENTVSTKLLKDKIEFYESLDPMPAMPYTERELNLQQGYSRITMIEDSTTDTLIPGGLYKINVNVAWIDNQELYQSQMFSTYIVK
jgi:type II secretory pathway pseudopilin PulG